MKINIDGQVYDVDLKGGEIVVNGKSFAVRSERTGNEATVQIGGKTRVVELKGDTVVLDGKSYKAAIEGRPAAPPPAPRPSAPAAAAPPAPAAPTAPSRPEAAAPTVAGTVIRAPMPGKILRVGVKEGDKVAYGTVLMVLEAMKMENEIRSTVAGIIRSLPVAAGSTVNANEPLAVIEG